MKASQVDLPSDWGDVLCGRGTTDHRGPFIAAVLAFRSMQAIAGELPLNIVYAIEGEEEIGSPNLKNFVNTYKDELSQADAFWFPRTSRESITDQWLCIVVTKVKHGYTFLLKGVNGEALEMHAIFGQQMSPGSMPQRYD